jgi:dienelactone hydrolase
MADKIQCDDFLRNHILSNIKIDKTETFGLYTDSIPNEISNGYKRNLRYLDLRGYADRKLDLPFEADDYYIGDQKIYLKQLKEKSTIFYSYSISDLCCSELFTIPFLVEQFAFNDSSFYFTAEVQGVERSASVKCSRRGPFFKEGRGVPGEGVSALFRSDINGMDISLISSLDMNIDLVDFDFLNNHIFFSAFKAEILKPVDSVIYSYNIVTESVVKIFDDSFRINSIQSMDKETLFFMGVNLKANSRNDNQQIYRIHLENGTVEQWGDRLDQSNENISVISDSIFSQSCPVQKYGEYFYFKQVGRDRELLCRISPSGEKEVLIDFMKTISSYAVTGKGLFLIGLKDLALSQIYFSDGNQFEPVSVQNKWLEEISLSKAEPLTLKVDGCEIDGYVYSPLTIEEGCVYPAVLMIHGGPKMLYSDVFAHDIQLLCANGYYVFNANPMGSDGRGDAFSNIRGQFGNLPFQQLMAFTDRVLDLYPQIDRENLGVTGGSYGGYMTNYIITRTSRFKAAVSERGISNLMTAFTSSDIGPRFVYEYMGNHATPWSDPQLYLDASPIASVDKVSTPTLFIHGKDDYTCHYSESLNMYSALNYLGVESKFCLFEGEGHGLVVRGKPLSKQRRYREFLSWFNQYLKKGSE